MNSLSTSTTRVENFADGLALQIDERGSGQPVLVLHGGAGPQSVAGFAAALSDSRHIFTPTHPGFAGQPRPDWLNSAAKLAEVYLELLQRLDLRDVMVVGFSMGGWVAAEMAVHDTARLSSIVLVDATGIQVDGHEVADVLSLKPDELSALSFHNPAAFRVDPATITPEQIAGRAANFKALAAYGGEKSYDPQLKAKLAKVTVPALVVWGASDRVADTDYGRTYAQAFANARFEIIPEAGHVPQIEQPERLLNLVRAFAAELHTA